MPNASEIKKEFDRTISRRADMKPKKGKKGFFDKIQQAVQDAIWDHIDDGEELISWVDGLTAPAEIMSWLPILSTIYKLKRKWWLIALTDEKLYFLEHGRMSASKILDVRSFPIESVRSMSIGSGMLLKSLVVQLSTEAWTFKEMMKSEIQPFISQFRSLKRKK